MKQKNERDQEQEQGPQMEIPKSEKKRTHHFDSDSAVALARFRKHVAPALSEIP
jgi:hypothetical protein